MYSDTLLFVNMYLKSELKHCCYLTVTVNCFCGLFISGLVNRPLLLLFGALTGETRGGALAVGHGFSEILLKDIFCTETQNVILYIFIILSSPASVTNVVVMWNVRQYFFANAMYRFYTNVLGTSPKSSRLWKQKGDLKIKTSPPC